MSFIDRMTPTLREVRSRLPDAIADLNRGNALAILAASQPLVPVDTGALKRSGRVEPDPKGAAVLVYGGSGFTNPRTGRVIDYAGVVHYRKGVKHPIGQDQYVGMPLRQMRSKRVQATARAMRKWLEGV